MSAIFDKTTDALAASVDMRLIRNKVTASNIANAETPGFKAQKMDFEETLSRAIDNNGLVKMHTEHRDHFPVGAGSISGARADVYDNPDVNVSNDGNTVDLEREMSNLSDNTIMYKAALQMIKKKLGTMKYAVTEGGGR